MKFGLTKEQQQYIFETAILPLQREGAKVYCYGSRARGDFKKFSDLDLMVESDHELSQKIGQILELLQKSNFPYKVDLVQLKDFAKSYLPQYQKDKMLWA